MIDPVDDSQTCFSCGGSRIKEEQHDRATRYTCLECGEEWLLDADQSGLPGSKKHKPPERLAKTPKEAAGIALAAACNILACPITLIIKGSAEINLEFLESNLKLIGIVMFIALVAAGLGALLALRVHKIIAIVLGGIVLVGWWALNLYIASD